MTPEIVVSIVTTGGVIIVAIIANQTRQHARAARSQVENNHTTNLREEGDDRHVENQHSLGLIINTLKHLQSDVGGMRHDIRNLQNTQADHARELEDTKSRERTNGQDNFD